MLRYLISILIGGILLLIFKDWLGISRKHPPRQKATHQPDATSEHEPETIPPSTSNVHQPTIIAQSAPNEHGQSIPDEHKPAVAAQPLPDDHESAESLPNDHKTVKKDQSRPVLVSEPNSRDAVSNENDSAHFTEQGFVATNGDSATEQQDISSQTEAISLNPAQNNLQHDLGTPESKQNTVQLELGNTEMLANPASKLQDQTSVPPKTESKASHDADFSSRPRAKSKRSPFKSWFSFKRPVNWSTAAQPLNWSNLLTTKPISNAAYLEQLQQWDRHLSMVADHDEIATQARQNFSDAQKNAFFQDPFPGLRFLAYEMAKTYSWYSHGTDRSPHELAMLSKDLKGIIQLHERATQLLQGDIGERRVYQLLQELYPHEELLDSLNLPFDYYKKQNTAAVNQIDIILITRNGVLIPEVKNYQGLALQLTKDGDFIIAYPNGYCEQIKNAAEQLSNHEHAVSRLLFEDANARQILMNAQPVIHSMFVAANPDQATIPAPGMRNRLYSLSQLDQFAKFKAKRPLTGLEQRYLKELLASRETGEREYEQPFIINLAKLERQLLAMAALNDQYLNDNSPLTRYVDSDMLTSLHRGNFIDDHCRLR
ncbi:Nuclease-related domain-containing protein [Limosilactobacillus mucosae]|nr:Nuclease-related domain-containing protein [Limosilactobacillus mucosae]SEL34740.1 Nuclease-related domain-containing protein [Limosilactobacillus mucosae]SFK38849.1 Nuclease-related domain-containing protein [Limosilactobacillus mucosae]